MSPLTHLWQSTLCVAIAALLTLALRHTSARTRHTIWLFASLKFLVPFSFLVVAGSYVGALTSLLNIPGLSPSGLSTPGVSIASRWLDHSLSFWHLDVTARLSATGIPLPIGSRALLALAFVWAGGVVWLTVWRWREWQIVSRLARASTRLEHGREVEMLRRLTGTAQRPRRIAILQCAAHVEPGILGVLDPKLLWPVGLSDRLSDPELEAVLAHEACHVDRRDNLSACIHMVVETVFWFHPVVWWIGTRLVKERERACDEEVLRMGADKRNYAEGILKVCGFCLQSPNGFVAGVGSSNLTKRIERLLQRPMAPALTLPARLLVAGVLLVTAGAPLVAGVVDGRRGLSRTPAQGAQHEEPKVYRVGEGIESPKPVSEVKPVYTKEAMAAKIQGSLSLEAVVLESGLVGDVEIIDSLDQVYGLDDQAIKAIKEWRFTPGTKDGKAVAVRVEVEFTFTLK